MVGISSPLPQTIWVRSRKCSRLVTWFCYQMIAKPGNKTAAASWPDPYTYLLFDFDCALTQEVILIQKITSCLPLVRPAGIKPGHLRDSLSSRLNACSQTYPDSKVHGANMGPTWGRQGPGGPHVGPMNFAIWGVIKDEAKTWSWYYFSSLCRVNNSYEQIASWSGCQGPVSIQRPSFPGMGISMLKIRQSQDRLIFSMGIPRLVRQHLYIETALRFTSAAPESICHPLLWPAC